MYLSEVTLKNYKCFNQATLRLSPAPGINVLIGKNGTGKTSLIQGICKALSFMFSNNREFGADFISAGLTTLNVRSFDVSDFRRDNERRMVSSEVSISAKGTLPSPNGKKIKIAWQLLKRSLANAALQPSLYKTAFREVAKQYTEGKPLPIVAMYSASFPHHNTKLTKQVYDAIRSTELQRNFGFYQWDNEDACISLWEGRLCNNMFRNFWSQKSTKTEISENNNSHNSSIDLPSQEAEAIISTLKTFSHKLSEPYNIDFIYPIQTDQSYHLCFKFKSGKELALNELPSGYERLFAIALDLAYRGWIINQDTTSAGIAIIDEIDLHLHPELEQDVAQIFCETFPGTQFIVSTHSPLVISNINTSQDGNKVISLDSDQAEFPEINGLYGLDYESALTNAMEVGLRTSEIDSLIESYIILSDAGMKEEASNIKNIIKADKLSEEDFIAMIERTRVRNS